MSKNTSLLLIIWNVVLSALLGWSLLRKPATAVAEEANVPEASGPVTPVVVSRDSGALKEARIAFFHMDSITTGYAMVLESDSRLKSEGKRIQAKLDSELARAQARYEELSRKDPTYLTQAERQKDESELMELQARLQKLDADSKRNYAEMQNSALEAISDEIDKYLDEYNATAQFDYIFSIAPNGQIWTGNDGLDITNDLLTGLNQRYHAGKGAVKK